MTIQDIREGNINIEDNPTYQELKDLIFALKNIRLNDDNVDNVIAFLNYCSRRAFDPNGFDMDEHITWYLLHLIDTMSMDNEKYHAKIVKSNMRLTNAIRKNVKEKTVLYKKKEYPKKTVWDEAWTDIPLETARKKKHEETGEEQRDCFNCKHKTTDKVKFCELDANDGSAACFRYDHWSSDWE